jgi:hypothetical protein
MLSRITVRAALFAAALSASLGSIPVRAADNTPNEMKTDPKPELRFPKEGRFKIVQFTDTHLTDLERRAKDDTREVMAARAATLREKLFATIRAVLDAERPDMVIFTGDSVLDAERPFELWRDLAGPVIERGIPWAAVMGNHDSEITGKSQRDLMSFLATLPLSLCESGPDALGGGGNYVIPILSRSSPRVAAALFCMDSGDYADAKVSTGYAWFKHDSISWFREKSRELAAANAGAPLPALAFFHIPLPEFNEAFSTGPIVGQKKENVCCPKLNSGMFTALLESGSVLGAFTGHDHNNDCAAAFRGILLAYGRKTGDFCYLDLPSDGARVIELAEGSRRFSSWIRNGDGQVEFLLKHPDDSVAAPDVGAAPK